MNSSARVFNITPAVREAVPLLIGITGPSGGGKTYSALRLATGIQSVSGGDIFAIDTEARRMLHYAEKFKFRHLQFDAPFGSLDYLTAIRQCASTGAKIIIVDSMSHEHEGPGGMLDYQIKEFERLGNQESKKMLAWQKPKAARQALLNGILQIPANFIFCFRAKEKIKMVGGKVVPQGFMPIAGDEFVFEMTVNALLLPHANGIPTWKSEEPGERMMMKLPEQFMEIFAAPQPLSEEMGVKLATWATGSSVPILDAWADILDGIRNAARDGSAALKAHYKKLSKPARKIADTIGEELRATAVEADAMNETPEAPANVAATEDVI